MLDPNLQSLLASLRSRIRRYVVWDSLLAILAIVLSAFWIGLLIDYGPVALGGSEMPRSARALLLFAVGLVVLLVLARMLIARLSRPLPDSSLALLVERHHPQLQGRLVTAVELTRPGRKNDSHSPELLRRVHLQAAESVEQVDPNRVFRREPLMRKAAICIPLILIAIGFALYSPSAFGRAAARLTLLSDQRWPRRARLEMVGIDLPRVVASSTEDVRIDRVTFDDGLVRLPLGSSATLRIRADAETAEVPAVCTVYYRTTDGTRGQSNMRRVGRKRDGFQAFVLDGPPMSNLSESFSFSVQGLDDRLNDFRVEAIQPPAITSMNVSVRYPDYLRETAGDDSTFDLETEYQAGLRIREGSDVRLVAESSLPLESVDVVVEYGGEERPVDQLTFSDDRSAVQFSLTDVRSATAIRLVPSGGGEIRSQAPYRYFLGAIVDQPPSIRLALSGIQAAVTPIARLPLECVTEDDYQVTALSAFLAVGPAAKDQTSDGNPVAEVDSKAVAVPMQPDRDGAAETVIDLRELTNDGEIPELQPGGSVSVYAEVRDGYDLDGMHLVSSEIYRLQVVTPAELLTLLERRELGLRTRLEQTVSETEGLRDQLARFRTDGFAINATPEEGESEAQGQSRQRQILRLRVQQAGLQASKTTEELTGIAESLDDLLREMINNRIDSRDRQERLGRGVRDPLRQIVENGMAQLAAQIRLIEQNVENPSQAVVHTEAAIGTAEKVLLDLSAVLEKMLDLESYNELLDLVRGLIDDQKQLKDETREERKRRVKDLFD